MPCSCKCDCKPFEAKVGFAIGVGCGKCEDADLLKNYINCEDWFPQVEGLQNGIGSKWWKIGDQVHLHINLQFVAPNNSDTLNITGLPQAIKADSLVSNGAILEQNFTDPVTLVNAQLKYNAGDTSSLDLVVPSNLVQDDVYTLNAQIVFSCS